VAETVITLWRPVGPTELELIAATGMGHFPSVARATDLLSCPHGSLCHEHRAGLKRATRWRIRHPVLQVRAAFLARYEIKEAGGRDHREYWIPAEDLPACDEAIVGEIEVTAEFSWPGL
jgi:hypothetical protein